MNWYIIIIYIDIGNKSATLPPDEWQKDMGQSIQKWGK